MEKEEIAGFYDQFGHTMDDNGLHSRHWSIYDWLKSLPGFCEAENILEIGAGPGPVTWLIAKLAERANVLAVDISEGSIELAKSNLKTFGDRIDFLVSDMSDFAPQQKFDFVVMPDVLEHIPLEQQPALFQKLSDCMKPGGLIAIHLPDRHYLQHIRETQPELLQIIDQSISSGEIVASLQGTELEIVGIERYALGTSPCDYRRILIEKEPALLKFTRYRPAGVEFLKRALRKVFRNRFGSSKKD